jgi:hypothetical protein
MKPQPHFATAAVAIAGFAVLASCHDKSPPTTSDTTTTGVEVQHRQVEIPSLMGQVDTTAVKATEGAAAGAMSGAAGAAESPAASPGGQRVEPVDDEHLDANGEPLAARPDGGH